MKSFDRLRKILPKLPRITVHGLWSRAVGFHLLKAPPPGSPRGSFPQPLWPGGPAHNGARFTPKGSFGSVYLADDPVTALYEVVSVFQPPGGPRVTLKTNPWALIVVEGVVSNIVDLTDLDVQRETGTSLAELTGDWLYLQATGGIPPTQILGRAAFECGILGLRYSSAKNIGYGNALVVFTEHLAANKPSYLEVIDQYHNLSQRLP